MGNLVFNGTSTVELGVHIQTPPSYEYTSKKYDVVSIEGRNGDLIIDKMSYRNVFKKYNMALGFTKNSSFEINAKKIVDWLLSAKGYARLEDTYEPDYYRMAMIQDQGELPNIYDQATVFEVSFYCKPQRFLKSGECIKEVPSLGTFLKIINPTKHIALPKIIIDGDGLKLHFYAGNDYADPVTQTCIESSYNSEFTMDCELEDCYTVTDFVNNYVSVSDGFPKLYPGVNWVMAEGDVVRNIKIQPRWWTL